MKRAKWQIHGRRETVTPVLLEVLNEDEYGRPKETKLHYDKDPFGNESKIMIKDTTRRFWVVWMANKDVDELEKGKALA